MSSEESNKRRPGRPKEPQKRENLLAKSRAVFAEKGYDGARLQQIADASGLSKPALFPHFVSKDELYEAVLEGMVTELGAYIYASSSAEGSFVERLRRLAGNLADYFGKHPDAAKLLLREFVNNGPYTSGKGQSMVRSTLKMARDFIAAGVDDGSFSAQEPERLVLAATADLLFYYGAHELSSEVLGSDSLTKKNLKLQRQEVIEHFCRLVRAQETD